tara:strand:- start:3042 stop:3539 length:498 start_codon:yes stop_codon:yes gene_type:complete
MNFRFILKIFSIFVVLSAQEKDFNKNHDLELERLKWEVVKKNIEDAVARGEISPDKAVDHYNFYRNREEIDLIPRDNVVLEHHFKKLGIEDLTTIKDDLLQKGIEESQIEATLGGILRLVKSIKSDSQNVSTYPRLEAYFRERLSLKNSQVKYIMEYSENLAGLN